MIRRLIVWSAVAVALAVSALGATWALLPDPAPLATQNPRTTALIEQRRAEARAAHRPFRAFQVWAPLDRVSPRLVQAVLVSEDAAFYAHGAFDWHEVSTAVDDSLRDRRALRGASTITQQLAKNVWLGTERTAWRKAKEAVLALKLERRLSKRRILTLYLNVAEWGNGVFGVEAAARSHFGAPAADLTTAQAALLAAMLPAPRRADLAHPSRWLARRARRIVDRLHAYGRIDAAEHSRASAELERIVSGSTGPDTDEAPDDAGAG